MANRKKFILHFNIAGLTLIEIMITVLIIGILAAVATPVYIRQVEKSRGTEARATLLTIYRNYKIGFEEDPSFSPNLNPASDWTVLSMDNPNASTQAWFAYWVTPPTALAVRRQGNPPFAAYTFSVIAGRQLSIDLDTGTITASPEY